MIRTRTIVCAALAAAAAVSLSGVARATPTPINNTTEVAYYSNGSPYNNGSGYWGSPDIGYPTYYTPYGQVSAVNLGGGQAKVTITFSTGFYMAADNTYTGAPYYETVYPADIFIGGSSATPNSNYDYAISLGFDGKDGGYTSAGIHSLTPGDTAQYYTSKQIWSTSDTWNEVNSSSPGNRADFYYGGAYAPSGTCSGDLLTSPCSAAQTPPTVLMNGAGGTVSGITSVKVTEGAQTLNELPGETPLNGPAAGYVSVQLVGSVASLENIFDNFDIFWGTGDCSNAPIWGDIRNLTFNAPEPSTLAILASALALLGLVERRRRRGPAQV